MSKFHCDVNHKDFVEVEKTNSDIFLSMFNEEDFSYIFLNCKEAKAFAEEILSIVKECEA